MDINDLKAKMCPYFIGVSDALWDKYVFSGGISATVWIQGITDPICNVKEIHISGDNSAIMVYDEYSIQQNGITLRSAKTYFPKEIMDVVIV